MPENLDYIYIRAWGKRLSSFDYYIERQIEIARREKAPQNAIYKLVGGGWVTIDQCVPETQAEINAIVNQIKGI